MQKLRGILAVFAFYTISTLGFAQPESYQHIDGIIGVVGNEIILSSELDEMILQESIQGKGKEPNQKCQLFEDMLFEKLLLHHARVDSLEVTDAEVMDEIDRRLAFYINMLGSIEAFEACLLYTSPSPRDV